MVEHHQVPYRTLGYRKTDIDYQTRFREKLRKPTQNWHLGATSTKWSRRRAGTDFLPVLLLLRGRSSPSRSYYVWRRGKPSTWLPRQKTCRGEDSRSRGAFLLIPECRRAILGEIRDFQKFSIFRPPDPSDTKTIPQTFDRPIFFQMS